ncbi:MAG: HEAT repeat domain-containing protein, partial [Terriglobales bacterium]
AGLIDCVAPVFALATEQTTALTAKTALTLADWLQEQSEAVRGQPAVPNDAAIDQLRNKLNAELLAKVVLETLSGSSSTEQCLSVNLKQAIALSGDLKLEAAVAPLITLAQSTTSLRDDAIEALGTIGAQEAAKPLLALSKTLVELSQRTALPLSKQPVVEDDPVAVKTYWQILKALATATSPATLEYLLEAACDYAPDKREQAVSSLVPAFLSLNKPAAQKPEVVKAIHTALSDPSAPVRLAALIAAGQVHDPQFIPEIIKLTESRESSVSKQAFCVLETLSESGYRPAVTAQLEERIRTHSDDYRKKQLSEFLAQLS